MRGTCSAGGVEDSMCGPSACAGRSAGDLGDSARGERGAALVTRTLLASCLGSTRRSVNIEHSGS